MLFRLFLIALILFGASVGATAFANPPVNSLTSREIETLFSAELRRTVFLQNLAQTYLKRPLVTAIDSRKLFAILEDDKPELRHQIEALEQLTIKTYLRVRNGRVAIAEALIVKAEDSTEGLK